MARLRDPFRTQLSALFRDRPASPSRTFARRLAQTLRWEHQDATIEIVGETGLPGDIIQGLIRNQPAVLFCGHQRSENTSVLHDVASFAYQNSLEWGIISNALETVIFNSHWLTRRNWFSLPPITDAKDADLSEVLRSFTPEGLYAGDIDRTAMRVAEPTDQLLPVDDALVDRLDTWRDEALRFANSPTNVDEKLQTLFAQFFVLRAIEDRALLPGLPTLKSVVRPEGTADLGALRRLFATARESVQSELFSTGSTAGFPDFLLGGIINELYTPSHLPIKGFKYNFAWIDPDILGRAYEKYLSAVLVPSPLVEPQLRLFQQPKREVERVSRRKSSGVYYTPTFIVQYLTERALTTFYQASNPDRVTLPRIADIACGSGSFLTTAVEQVVRRMRNLDPTRNWARELISRGCILGIDIDQRAVTLARLTLWLHCAKQPRPLPLPKLEDAIRCADSLSRKTWDSEKQRFDIVLGNPPFVPSDSLVSRPDLLDRFEAAQGKFDFSYLFIEQSINRLSSQGILALVVPSRVLTNRDAGQLRNVITRELNLRTLTDFGSTQVFAGATTYVALLLAQKIPTSEAVAETLRAIRVKGLPVRFASAMLLAADEDSRPLEDTHLAAFPVKHPRGPDPWVLMSPREVKTRLHLQDSSETLSDVAGVFQGIKTGANDVFIFEVQAPISEPIIQVRNLLGETSLIETSLLKPVIFGSDIQRYSAVTPNKLLLYPYRNGNPVSEAQLRQLYPRAYSYLQSFKDVLQARSSTKGTGKQWYELVKERNENWLNAPKMVMRDLATVPSFALDSVGRVAIVGGTAVVPSDPACLLPLMAYLNSRVAAWYLGHLAPSFRAGFQKFEPQHLSQLPIPLQITHESPERTHLASLAADVIQAKMAMDTTKQQRLESLIDGILFELAGVRGGEIG